MHLRRLTLRSGDLLLDQPTEAADLPDGGPIEWAPIAPYWAVLWRSGVALARELDGLQRGGQRVVELGCGLGVPSLVAARAGAQVRATDEDGEALELLRENASRNGLELDTAVIDWSAPEALIRLAPFDLVLAADVLYDEASVAPLLALLPELSDAVLLADPGREPAAAFMSQARAAWAVRTTTRDGIEIHQLARL